MERRAQHAAAQLAEGENEEIIDPMFRNHEKGSYLADQIRIQYIPDRIRANQSQGIVQYDGKLLGFRAYSPYRSPASEQEWDVYVPMDPRRLPDIPNIKPFTKEDGERLRKSFPSSFPLENQDYEAYITRYQLPESTALREAFRSFVSDIIKEVLTMPDNQLPTRK